MPSAIGSFFFFNDTATTEIYTLSLHDALPISVSSLTISPRSMVVSIGTPRRFAVQLGDSIDRKSTRLNSSHSQISYAVFCLKKKNRRPDFQKFRLLLKSKPSDKFTEGPKQRQY